MPTLGEMIEDVISELHGRTNSQEQQATLLSTISAGDLSFAMDDVNTSGRGIYEIDSELVYVATGNQATGTCTVPAWGRAQQGTTAVTHLAGSRITRTPRFPRARVKTMLLEATAALYPELYAVFSTEFAADWITPQYVLPAATERVISVEYQVQQSANQQWVGVRGWKLGRQAPTDEFASGISLTLARLPYPSTQVRVVYSALPGVMTSESDSFATVTGLRGSASDLPRLAVLARLVVAPEVAKGQITAIEQSDRSSLVQTGSTTSVARYFLSLYQQRMRAEQTALRMQVPVRVVRTWQ